MERAWSSVSTAFNSSMRDLVIGGIKIMVLSRDIFFVGAGKSTRTFPTALLKIGQTTNRRR
jgi:hypothetical protein